MKRVSELEKDKLCGFVFKSRSPSSGMQGVKVFTEAGMPSRRGSGIFARIFMEHFPHLPVEDDGRLHDDGLRENFIERLFVMQRWYALNEKRPSQGALVRFHTRHKLLVMAHSQKHMVALGRLVAGGKRLPSRELFERYFEMLMEALRLKSSARKNTNVLQHIAGHFKRQLDADEKQEIQEVIQDYYDGHVPLIVPVTLLKHYVRKFETSYLNDQYYLNPHPIELRLRNHA